MSLHAQHSGQFITIVPVPVPMPAAMVPVRRAHSSNSWRAQLSTRSFDHGRDATPFTEQKSVIVKGSLEHPGAPAAREAARAAACARSYALGMCTHVVVRKIVLLYLMAPSAAMRM